MKRRLTEKRMKGFEPPAKGCYYVYDTDQTGLAVRITAAGTRTFTLDYWNKYGEKRRYNIGQWLSPIREDDGRASELTVEKAVLEAKRLTGLVADGEDPVQDKKSEREKVKAEPKVKDLVKAFLEQHVVRNGEDQQRNSRSMANKIVLPKWKDKRVNEITEEDVRALHESKRDTPYRANRLLFMLKKMFAFAMEDATPPMAVSNPAKRVRKFPEDPRTTYMQPETLRALHDAITEYGQESAELIRLILLTGYRKREWQRAKKAEFTMATSEWSKPSRRVKNRKPITVKLSPQVMEVLRRVMASAPDSEYLFPGKKKNTYRKTVRRPWEQILRKVGLAQRMPVLGKDSKPKLAKDGQPLMKWKLLVRIHDLRHSYASFLAESGVPLLVIGQALGHLDPATTKRYAHISDKSAVMAQDQFGRMITERVQ